MKMNEMICPECGKSFPGEFRLSYHRKLTHGVEPPEDNTPLRWWRQGLWEFEELVRDKSSDYLLDELGELGLEVQLAERGRFEERTGQGSLGLILISGSPIRWVNLRKLETGFSDSGYSHNAYVSEYGIPDSRLLSVPEMQANLVSSFSGFGRAIKVRAKGVNIMVDIKKGNYGDTTVGDFIIDTGHEVTVQACSNVPCWLIPHNGEHAPKLETWRCYELIAAYLLARPDIE